MPEKYQDEIEDILKDIEETGLIVPAGGSEPAPDDLPIPMVSNRGGNRENEPSPDQGRLGSGAIWRVVTPGKLALAGLVMLLVGVLLGQARFLVWVGLAALAAAYLLFFIRPRQVNRDKHWRGRAVESSAPSPWRKFKTWFKD